MAKKGNRVQVILECTEHKTSGKPGTSRYITVKNKKNNPERLELKKFNPILKKSGATATQNLKRTSPTNRIYWHIGIADGNVYLIHLSH